MPRPQPEVKQLLGAMDLDSPPEVIHPGAHRTARNGRFVGISGNQQWQTIESNVLMPGQTLPAGINLTIGRHDDDVYQRIFYFNYNSNGTHSIRILNTVSGIFQILVEIGSNTDGDILGFTATGTIQSIGILYLGSVNGNLLVFIDSLGRTTKINIDRFLGNPGFTPYTLITRADINLIKAPPVYPPRVCYENDLTVNTNNLINSLFKFAYAYIYDDNELSIISSGSVVPLPVVSFSTGIQSTVKTDNARIGIYVNSGPANVVKIRFFMKQTQNGSTSDWFEIDTVDKSDSGIADNAIYKYLFYNNGNYTTVDPAYGIQQQDYTPPQANSLALPNGNVVAAGGITEGYDWFKSVFSFTNSASNPRSSIPGFLFFADYDGTFTGSQPNIKLIVTGAGLNDVNGNPVSLDIAAERYFLYASSSVDGDISFNYSSVPAPPGTIPTILSSIQSAAVSAGWTFVSSDTNSITIYYPNGTVNLKSTYYDLVTVNLYGTLLNKTARLAHYESSAYSYGVQYFDDNDNSNGSITDETANITTVSISSSNIHPVTGVKMNLNGITPPPWARSWSPIRTDTLTFLYRLDWVSNRTLNGTGQLVATKYAYIDITNIDLFNEEIQASASQPQVVVSYGFVQGDRVRINARYNTDGTVANYFSYDYQILDLAINPIINGNAEDGRFLKITYPQADITAAPAGTYDFAEGFTFANYSITIYRIASNTKTQTANQQSGNVYYQVGFKFGIGNPGLITAFHYGNAGDNQVLIEDGDIFSRIRTVPAGPTYYLYADANAFSGGYLTVPLASSPIPTIIAPDYTISTQPALAADLAVAQYPQYTDSGGLFVNNNPIGGASINIRLRGSFQVSSSFATWVGLLCKLYPSNSALYPVLVDYIVVHSDGVGDSLNVQTITVTFDQIIKVPPQYKVWLIYQNGVINAGTTNTHFNGFLLRMDVVKDFTISVYDKSYSDTYNLATNSDNRPSTEDIQAKQTYYPTLLRWSQPVEPDTNINNTNRWYFNDSDELVKEWGDIRRLSIIGKLLYIFQHLKCGTVGIFQKYIINNQGQSQLIVNDQIFEKNNIRYEIYEGGIGNQIDSLCISNYAHYFVNPIKGHILRWSNDGVTILSELYRVQTWAGINLPNYLNTITYQFGGNARVLGTFRIFKDKAGEYMLVAQGGTNGTITQPGETLSFDEQQNAFTSFHDINCDAIVNAENNLYAFRNGLVYIHNDPSSTCKFFGVQYPCQITLIFNKEISIKKKYLSISYQSQDFWTSPNNGDVITSFYNPQTGLQQISRVEELDYSIEESNKAAAFNRDANSSATPQVAIWEGDYLEGVWIQVLLSYSKGKFNFIYAPYILFTISGRNF